MITQSQIKICYIDLSQLPISPGQGSQLAYAATKLDYGFDHDEDELGRELLAPLPVNIADELTPAIGVEEFDTLYQWFIA